MKTTFFLLAFTAVAGTAFAQLHPLPPPSTDDMVTVNPIGANAGLTHWESPTGLGAYKFASDSTLATPKPGTPDNVLGLNWSTTAPTQAMDLRAQMNSSDPKKGGTIRAIFLGESAGWLNDFGYTYSGMPKDAGVSFTVFSDIQALSGTPYPVNIQFGDYVDIPLANNTAPNFDFWLNGVGADGVTTPNTTADGGVYTAFNVANSDPSNSPGNVMWSSMLMVSTYYPGFDAYYNLSTFLVSFEDWRTDKSMDSDYNDYMFAVQFVPIDPSPDIIPVPEPSTYGLAAFAALTALALVRRLKRL